MFAVQFNPTYWINNKLCASDGHFQPRLSSKCMEQILMKLTILWYFELSCLLFLALFFIQYSERTDMKRKMFWIILSILFNCFSGQNLFCEEEVRRGRIIRSEIFLHFVRDQPMINTPGVCHQTIFLWSHPIYVIKSFIHF